MPNHSPKSDDNTQAIAVVIGAVFLIALFIGIIQGVSRGIEILFEAVTPIVANFLGFIFVLVGVIAFVGTVQLVIWSCFWFVDRVRARFFAKQPRALRSIAPLEPARTVEIAGALTVERPRLPNFNNDETCLVIAEGLVKLRMDYLKQAEILDRSYPPAEFERDIHCDQRRITLEQFTHLGSRIRRRIDRGVVTAKIALLQAAAVAAYNTAPLSFRKLYPPQVVRPLLKGIYCCSSSLETVEQRHNEFLADLQERLKRYAEAEAVRQKQRDADEEEKRVAQQRRQALKDVYKQCRLQVADRVSKLPIPESDREAIIQRETKKMVDRLRDRPQLNGHPHPRNSHEGGSL